MSDAPELKPCPFCGNDGTGPIEDALQICHFEHDFRADSWTVQCDKCSATMGYSASEDEAIEAWNHRADLVPAPSVSVKPLEWQADNRRGYEDWESASTPFGKFRIMFGAVDSNDQTCWALGLPEDWRVGLRTFTFQSKELAKAAAQADYEARIMAAIQIGPRRATPEALASLRAGEGFATSGAEDRWIEDMKAGVYDDPLVLRHQIIEATDPNFIWGALDNVHDGGTTLDDYAAAVSRAIRAALLPAPSSERVEP